MSTPIDITDLPLLFSINQMAEITFTDDNFDQEVLNSDKPVLVDFWAEWCGPCKMVDPVVHELSHDYEGKLKVGKLNVDENPGISMNYNVMSIPTLLFFKAGQPVKSLVGAQSKETYKKAIDDILTQN